ncbi:MAG: hypothetical protein LLG16_02930 [Euryarchaeota archaeon]|nr:hypothetical protein [Euryarchaeota archaeon]
MFLRIRCPRCGRTVSKERLYCPYCNANIYSPYQTRLGLDRGINEPATEEKGEGAPLWQQVVKVVLVLLFFIALILL